jgi:hypothetical protein
MNPEMNDRFPNRTGRVAFGFVIACFIFAAFVLAMRHSMQPPAIDADRAAERAKALAELRIADTDALNNPGWIDRDRGVVRLPISVALQITESNWQNPAAARSNLIARVEKAAAPLPKAAEKPSPFE